MCAQTPNFGWTPLALGPVVGRVVEQVGREHPVGDDPPVVVDVVDEVVERPQPLGEPALDDAPLVAVDQARDDVERPGPVDVLTVGVDGERDPHREDLEIGHPLAFAHLVEPDAVQQLDQVTRDRSRAPVVLQQFVHVADRTRDHRTDEPRPPVSFS